MGNTYFFNDKDDYKAIEIVELNLFNHNLEEYFKYFSSKHNKTHFSSKKYQILEELLIKYSLEEKLCSMISFICSLNYTYTLFNGIKVDSAKLLGDFQNEKKDLEILLDLIEDYLGDKNKKGIDSLLFKFNPTVTINNYFVIKQLLDAAIIGMEITKDNFQTRKKELLDNCGSFNYKKGRRYVLSTIIKPFYEYLTDLGSNQSDALKFIGVILHLSDIRSNKNEPIELFDSLSDNLDDIEIKNLRIFFTRS
ncbi:MAG: hypothetical protein L3J09_12000 [Flavobacteriaceae bacterium]|nr:hypothetical protein [Flavobacteriaceae bacterium]